MEKPGGQAAEAAKHAVLRQLSAALASLAAKMQAQERLAFELRGMAVRCEDIARAAREAATAGGRDAETKRERLAADLAGFARETLEVAHLVGADSLLGREVARAIGAHAEEIAALAQDVGTLPDAAAVRARLRPLSTTLASLPQTLRAEGGEAIREVAALSGKAEGFAARAEALVAAPGHAGREAMLQLSRDLRSLSADMSSAATRMASDAKAAVDAATGMAERAGAMGAPQPEGGTAALDRIARVIAGMQAGAKRDAAPGEPPGGRMAWDLGPGPRRGGEASGAPRRRG